MTTRDSSAAQTSNFTGTIPRYYDENLGPPLFRAFGEDMARRVGDQKPADVLEIAAGTGILSRQLKDALPERTRLTISDLNPAMLDVARTKFKDVESIDVQKADALDLPFSDAAFDVICCQFGVMFFPDKPRAYREAYRVLRGGGGYIFSVWAPFTQNAFAAIAQDTISKFFHADPPTFYRTPFGYHDVSAITAALSDAGFIQITAQDVRREVEIVDAEHFARGLVLGNPVSEEIRVRASADHDVIIAALAEALRAAFGRDPGSMTLNAIILQAEKG